jgi:type IV secretory pathway TrbF-like protein
LYDINPNAEDAEEEILSTIRLLSADLRIVRRRILWAYGLRGSKAVALEDNCTEYLDMQSKRAIEEGTLEKGTHFGIDHL